MVELILYLEPTKTSLLWNYVQQTTSNYNTTASKYACHVTMTGFFSTSNPEAIRHAFHDAIKAFPSLDTPTIAKPILVHATEPLKAHLLLPVTVSDDYHRLLSAFASAGPIRLKKINHISLAYWDEPRATLNDTATWHHFLQTCPLQSITQDFETISEEQTNWDIVLYQRTLKGEGVGEKHQFKELERYSI
ncbi:hypothetical protein K501DRAFT_198409 [Backusella circina FSU 941]|nr:hypothetical protein K501DRAFT_198409 [Backusella circina FSU 941]